MKLLQMLLAGLFLLGSTTVSMAEGVTVERVATFGEPDPVETARETVGSVNQLWWLSDKRLLIEGVDKKGSYLRCLNTPNGKTVWEKRFGKQDLFDGLLGDISLSEDKAAVVIEWSVEEALDLPDDPELTAEQMEEAYKEQDLATQVAVVFDAMTGKLIRKVTNREIYLPTRRSITNSFIHDVIAGPTQDQVLVVFNTSLGDVDRISRGRADDNAVALSLKNTFGYRAYLVDLKRKRSLKRYQMDPYIMKTPHLALKGRYLGYVSQEMFCVYDAQRKRDQLIFGKHAEKPTGFSIVIDAPFFSNIRVGEKVAVITKDYVWQGSQLIVIDMKSGKVLVNQNAIKDGHVELAVDFDRERIAITGSGGSLALYDFKGDELINIENASAARNYTLAFSPDGKRLAVGGELGVVEVFSIRD